MLVYGALLFCAARVRHARQAWPDGRGGTGLCSIISKRKPFRGRGWPWSAPLSIEGSMRALGLLLSCTCTGGRPARPGHTWAAGLQGPNQATPQASQRHDMSVRMMGTASASSQAVVDGHARTSGVDEGHAVQGHALVPAGTRGAPPSYNRSPRDPCTLCRLPLRVDASSYLRQAAWMMTHQLVKSPRMLRPESDDSTWMKVQRLGALHA